MQPTAQQLATTGGKAVEGAWYGNQRFVGGQLLNPNESAPGVQVSDAVNLQSAAAQGKDPAQFLSYVHGGATNTNGGAGSGGSLAGGVSGMGSGAPAVPNLQALYDSAYTNNPDVIAANKSITDLQGQLTTKQQARDLAVKNENDNPFYAEATRVGRVQKINDNYDNEANTITNQLSTAQTNLTNLQAEAQRQVNLAQGQYTLNNDAWKQNLDEFNTLLAAGGLTNASPQALAAISVSTGISTDMLSSIQKSQQAKNTQIITSTDNAGNVTISAVDASTGKLLNQQSLGGVGAAKTGAGTKANTSDGLSAMTPKILSKLNSYGNISPSDWNQAQAAWIAAGLPKSDFVANFGQYADTNRGDFLQAYGFANPKNAATVKANQAQNTKPVN